MKNKLILALAFLLVMNTGVIYADTDTKTGGEKLFEYGFIQGDNGDIMEDKSFTRAEAAVLLAEMYGKKSEATNTVFTNYFSDVQKTDWFAPYVTFAKSNGWINGYPDGSFKPQNSVSQQEWSTMLMNVLGYDFTWSTVNDDIETLGINIVMPLTASLKRGEAFEVMWQAVNTPRKGQSVKLGEEVGKFEATLVEEDPEPEDQYIGLALKVSAHQIISQKQIHIKFNQPLNETAAETLANYVLTSEDDDDVTIIDATYDESDFELVLTLEEAQEMDTVLNLTIKNMISLAYDELNDVKLNNIEMIDMTSPEVASANFIGKNLIKILFSEPVMGDEDTISGEDDDIVNELDEEDFLVDDGERYIDTAILDRIGMSVILELFDDVDENVTLKVKPTVKDFSGYNVVEPELTVKYKEDKTAPEITGYRLASNTSVVITFDEDIKLVNGLSSNYYHDNKAYTIDTSISSSNISGNELTLSFSKNPMSDGEHRIVIKSDSISDYWGNENDSLEVEINVNESGDDPELEDIIIEDDDMIILVINKSLDNITGDVTDKDNYVILDDDKEDVSDLIDDIDYDAAANEIILYFEEALSGDYTVSVNNLVDYNDEELNINKEPFTVTDNTVPDPEDWTATYYDTGASKKIVKIVFGEPMNVEGNYSVADIENYSINGVPLDQLSSSKVSISVADNANFVEIYIYDEDHGGMDIDVDSNSDADADDDVAIARVEDASGNLTSGFVNIVDLDEMDEIEIISAELTDEKQITLTLEDELKSVYTSDFEVYEDDDKISISGYTKGLNEKGQMQLILKLKVALPTDADDITLTIDGEKSKNKYGEALEQVSELTVEDKVAPSVDTTEINDVITENVVFDESSEAIVITMSENIDEDSISSLTFTVKNASVNQIEVDDEKIYIYIDEDDLDNIKVGTKITQKYGFTDENGNLVEDLYLSVQDVD